MNFQNGQVLGRYVIRKKIGEGGMGEVFLAFDGQLDREVVLKILLPKFVRDADLVKRFKQEAKAVSALNHPNIITIYEIVEEQEFSFIVYEYISGETLRDKINRNRLTLAESVKVVEQVAKGLLAAHDAGIIHRDIKPENIMIREDGYVRILDFGLAKRSAFESRGESNPSQLVETKEGTIMGSVQYMSPEQARGEKMDERTDIWSLGVVFYEMVTGISPFAGKTLTDSIALVLKGDPKPPKEINSNIPMELQKIIGSTLGKDREQRYRSIKNLLLDLEEMDLPKEEKASENKTLQYRQDTDAKEPDISRENTIVQETQPAVGQNPVANDFVSETRSSGKWRWGLALLVPIFLVGAAIVAVVGFGGLYYYSSRFFPSKVPFQNIEAERLTKDQVARLPAISPDGEMIAYVKNRAGKQILTIKPPGLEGENDLFEAYAESILDVSFAPDGRTINFLIQENGLAMVFQIPAIGGEPKIVVQDVRSNVTYSPDGKRFAFIRFDIPNRISKVMISNSDGSDPKELINSKDSGFVLFKDLAWSPDGKNLLMVVLDGRPGKTFKYNLGTIEIDADHGKNAADNFRILEKDGCCLVSSVKWLRDGSGVLMLSRKADDKTRQIYFVSYPDGKSHRLTNDASNYSSIDVSADGTKIVASSEKLASSIWETDLVRSKSRQLSEDSEGLDNVTDIAVAEDGNLFYSKVDFAKGSCDISYFDPKTIAKQQFTLGGCVRGISFSPGQEYIFTSANLKGKGQQSILRLDRNAKNPFQITKAENVFDYLPQAAAGNTVFFSRLNIDGSFPKLMKVAAGGGEAKPVFAAKDQLELYPKVSPDGKYLAFNEFKKGELAATAKMLLRVVAIDNGEIGETLFEKPINQPTRFGWNSSDNTFVYVDPETLMNIKSVSFETKIERELTDFTSHSVYGPPAFSNDGKMMYMVRTAQIRDLFLIKSVVAKNN